MWADVRKLLQDPRRVSGEFQRRLHGDKSVGEDNVDQSRTRIQKLKRGITRLIDAYSDGLLEKGEFAPRIKKSKQRLERIDAELASAEQKQNQQTELRLVIGRLEEFAERVSGRLEEADWGTQRAIVRALVKRVEVDKDNVRVVYRVDPGPFVDGPSRGQSLQHCWRRDYTALRRAPSGMTPHSTRRQRAINKRRASATIPTRR